MPGPGRRVRSYRMPGSTARDAAADLVLSRLAGLDEHVVNSGHRVILGEAIRAAGILPAQVLGLDDKPEWRRTVTDTLAYHGALLTRLVLTSRGLPLPSRDDFLGLVDAAGVVKDNPFADRHPLHGRIATLMFLAGEMAHVSDDPEVDCIGALLSLHHVLEMLVCLAPGGELAS